MTDQGMNPDQIERVFGALGRIEQKLDGHIDSVEKHVQHDQDVHKLLFDRVETLQFAHAKQKGFFSAIAAVGSVVGAGIGYVIEKYWVGH